MGLLPHYKNSKAGMEQFEPVYMNLFQVSLIPPPGVTVWDKELIIENVTAVKTMNVEQLPGEPVQQNFKGHKRSYAGSYVSNTSVDVSIDFEVNINNDNSMYVYKALRRWCDLVRDPLTGAMTPKLSYASKQSLMTVHLYKKNGDIVRTWIYPSIFPSSTLPAMDLEYGSGNIYKISAFKFRADYWEDITL
jgi:hypothetical protein